jgi:hypothetical protein
MASVPLISPPKEPEIAVVGGHIRFCCPACHAVIRAPLTVAGKKSKCPSCAERVQIPTPDDAEAAAKAFAAANAAATGDEVDEDSIEIVAADKFERGDPAPAGAFGPNDVLKIPDEEDDRHIRFDCAACGATIRAPRATAGKKSRCPSCRAQVRIPAAVRDKKTDDDLFELDIDRGNNVNAALTVRDLDDAAAPADDPSTIRFTCDHCKAVVRAPREAAGKKSRCPSCQGKVRIPEPAKLPDNPEESVEIQIVEASARRPSNAQGSGWADQHGSTVNGTMGGTRAGSRGPRGPIRFDCPRCGAGIKCPPQFAGKKSRCPNCRERVHIPRPKWEDPDKPDPIELTELSEDEEKSVLADLSRQTRNTIFSGLSGGTLDPEIEQHVELDGSVLDNPLSTRDEMPVIPRGLGVGGAAFGPGAALIGGQAPRPRESIPQLDTQEELRLSELVAAKAPAAPPGAKTPPPSPGSAAAGAPPRGAVPGGAPVAPRPLSGLRKPLPPLNTQEEIRLAEAAGIGVPPAPPPPARPGPAKPVLPSATPAAAARRLSAPLPQLNTQEEIRLADLTAGAPPPVPGGKPAAAKTGPVPGPGVSGPAPRRTTAPLPALDTEEEIRLADLNRGPAPAQAPIVGGIITKPTVEKPVVKPEAAPAKPTVSATVPTSAKPTAPTSAKPAVPTAKPAVPPAAPATAKPTTVARPPVAPPLPAAKPATGAKPPTGAKPAIRPEEKKG